MKCKKVLCVDKARAAEAFVMMRGRNTARQPAKGRRYEPAVAGILDGFRSIEYELSGGSRKQEVGDDGVRIGVYKCD